MGRVQKGSIVHVLSSHHPRKEHAEVRGIEQLDPAIVIKA